MRDLTLCATLSAPTTRAPSSASAFASEAPIPVAAPGRLRTEPNTRNPSQTSSYEDARRLPRKANAKHDGRKRWPGLCEEPEANAVTVSVAAGVEPTPSR
jgi:hypothetical protein